MANQTNSLGAIIASERKQRQITQKALAERVGKTSTYLCLIEKGKYLPSVQTLEAIARELGLPLGYLFLQTIPEDSLPNKAAEILHLKTYAKTLFQK